MSILCHVASKDIRSVAAEFNVQDRLKLVEQEDVLDANKHFWFSFQGNNMILLISMPLAVLHLYRGPLYVYSPQNILWRCLIHTHIHTCGQKLLYKVLPHSPTDGEAVRVSSGFLLCDTSTQTGGAGDQTSNRFGSLDNPLYLLIPILALLSSMLWIVYSSLTWLLLVAHFKCHDGGID